ncbi:MAG: hypothetical protein V2B20_01410 [Pseudomonadota bacterium]
MKSVSKEFNEKDQKMPPLSFADAVEKLAKVGIHNHEIYLIDLILLCEMAWADGSVQESERELLFSYLNHHIDAINRLAGCRLLEHKEAKDLIRSFLDNRPDKALLDTIQQVIAPIRIDQIDAANAERTCLDILNTCLDIASSSVTKYPYGLTERFTQEEKEYYHKITAIITGKGNSF